MSTGNYGIIRPADVSPNDMEVFYHFTPTRDQIGNVNLVKLDPNSIVKKIDNPTEINQIFGGLYTLQLPTSIFNQKGIYTVVIKPKEIRTTILDCGVLSAFPNVRGIIFDSAQIPSADINKFENGLLVGYRIEYLSTDPTVPERKIQNLFRIVTSNNRAEAVSQNLNNTTQKALSYRFNDNSSLIFCTITPSSAPSVRPNALPYIGVPGQEVIITNTFFNPLTIEIDMVEYDIESLAYGLFANQTKSIDDGIYTIYNFQNQIYKQYNLFEIKDQFDKPVYEVREQRNNIDFGKDFVTVTSGL
jgi:hypothetical protein